MLANKLLALSTIFLASNGSVALSPVVPPAIPPDIRLTIGVNKTGLFKVYRAFERAATRAKLMCHPTMKDYESWRANGFEPVGRNMVCGDSRYYFLLDCSWANVAPESITIDVGISSAGQANKPPIMRLVAELKKSLKADASVMTVVQDTWSPEHSSSKVK
jgi:hypothetical protein